ncbi:MAG: glycosyltransferase family 2 protein [Anaerolineae bacterium]|nr:glycosyltransferase family 2 protein [Anaerolineae bacterium]
MSSDQPQLSIIIVAYNTREALRRCLASIQEHGNGLAIQTIVVDNGSRDNTAVMVREQMPDAVLIEPGYNTWFTGGNNLGVQAAEGLYVLILNADTVIMNGTLQRLVAYMQANPQVGAASCQMRYPDGRLQYTGSEIPAYRDLLLGYTLLGSILFFWRKRRRDRMWYAGWDRQTTRRVGVLPDSCLIMPATLWQQIEGFDETLKLYFTEDDICARIQAEGYECHYVADAVILHEEHASTSQVQRLATRVYFDDLVTFARKYYGSGRAALLRLMIIPLRSAMSLAQRLHLQRGRP